MARQRNPIESKRRLLGATVGLMLRQGFGATTVHQICGEAGLAKGAFFHHFKSKEAAGEAAVLFYGEQQTEALAQAPFQQLDDPLEKLHGLLDFVEASTRDKTVEQACLVGNLAQEVATMNPAIRCKCDEVFTTISDNMAALLKATNRKYCPGKRLDAKAHAMVFLSMIQGARLLAKTQQNVTPILHCVRHFRSTVEQLFGPHVAPKKRIKSKP